MVILGRPLLYVWNAVVALAVREANQQAVGSPWVKYAHAVTRLVEVLRPIS
jgi:hypothetical protein